MTSLPTFVEPHMASSLEDHELRRLVSVTPDFPKARPTEIWWMQRPGTSMMRVELVFAPSGIVLLGDLTPTRNGVISRAGYGISWFGSKQSEGYLCSKFLEETWVPSKCAAYLRELLANETEEAVPVDWGNLANGATEEPELHEELTAEQAELLRNLVSDLGRGEASEGMVYDEMSRVGFSMDDGIPGYDYDPTAAGWLCAIQQRFAELYTAARAVEAA